MLLFVDGKWRFKNETNEAVPRLDGFTAVSNKRRTPGDVFGHCKVSSAALLIPYHICLGLQVSHVVFHKCKKAHERYKPAVLHNRAIPNVMKRPSTISFVQG